MTAPGPSISRRAALHQIVVGLLAGAVAELGALREASADVSPGQRDWWRAVARDAETLAHGGLSHSEWQDQFEALARGVELPALLSAIRLPAMQAHFARSAFATGASRGPHVRPIVLEPGCLPASGFRFQRRLFSLAAGRAIVPHGHNNLATGFIVLQGRCRGRHFQRLADEAGHTLVTPSKDRWYGPGEVSTISDERDNVHWFTAEAGEVFLLNVGVTAELNGHHPELPTGRMYLDLSAPAGPDGTLRAPHLTEAEAERRFG